MRLEGAFQQPHESINLVLRKATRDALRSQGYTAELRRPDASHPMTHWLTLFNDDRVITIEYQHTLEKSGRRLRIEASVRMSRPALDPAEDVAATPSSVQWLDFAIGRWHSSLDTKDVVFVLATKRRLIVKLALDLAAPSHYFLHAEIVEEMPETTSAALFGWGASGVSGIPGLRQRAQARHRDRI